MGFYRLNVTINEKDEAKSYGAKWYAPGKYWYYQGENLPEGLKKWYKEQVISSIEQETFQKKSETAVKIPKSTDIFSRYKTVSEINSMIEDQYKATNEFKAIYVKGEVTGFSGKKDGHSYFSIKDSNAILSCIIWKPYTNSQILVDNPYNFPLKAGQQVAIFGNLTYYAPSGKTSLIVKDIQDIGEGMAKLALEKLRQQLQTEGLFDPLKKKPIPKHPKRIGILTSKNGQAIQDIESTRKQRNPYVETFLFDVNVQGKKAIDTMLEGIAVLDGMGFDLIIVGRGGGHDEELNIYNSEALCRAIFTAKTPIVTAIGHTGNKTLADDVADKCFITPTDAAAGTIPDVMNDIKILLRLKKNMTDIINGIINDRILKVENKHSQIEKNSPEAKLKRKTDRLNSLIEKMRLLVDSAYNSRKDKPQFYLEKITLGMNRNFEARLNRYEKRLIELNGLSPSSKLVRGYGYISKDGEPVSSAANVKKGDELNIRLRYANISATVDDVEVINEED